MKKVFLLVSTIFLGLLRLNGQNNDLRIKLNSLSEVKEDSQKVNILNDVASKFYYKNIDSTKKYALLALDLSRKINYKKGIGRGLNSLGVYYTFSKPPQKEKASDYFNKYLSLAREIDDKREIGRAYGYIGHFHMENQDFEKANKSAENALLYFRKINYKEGIADIQLFNCAALYYLNKPVESTKAGNEALDFYEQNNDSSGIGVAYINLSLSYEMLKNYNKSLEYSFKALKYTQKKKDTYSLWVLYNNIGDSYEKLKMYGKALEYNNKALDVAYANKIEFQIGQSEATIAYIYYLLKNYNEALKHSNISLRYVNLTNDKIFIFTSYQIASKINLELNNIDQAIKFANLCLNVSKGYDGKSLRIDSYELLTQAYEKKGDYKTSLEFHKKFKAANDSIYDKDVSNKLMELQTKYESEKKENENNMLRNQQELKNEVIKKQYLFMIGISAGLILSVTFTVILIRANSHRKKMYRILSDQKREIENYAEKLNDLNMTKDKFFSIIAHDLKNPFQALLGINSILVESPDLINEPKRQEFLIKMYDTTKNAFTLLENLLQWARTQMDGMEFMPEKLDLLEIIVSNKLLLKNLAEEKFIRIIVGVTEGLYIYSDRNMMDTILRNLISNAIKFTNDEGKISIAAEEKDQFVLISIKDNGIGIRKEDQANLFELGNGLTTRGTKNEKGSGLGLILCKEFVSKQNGTLWFDSEKDKGSTFYFTVPKFIPSTK